MSPTITNLPYQTVSECLLLNQVHKEPPTHLAHLRSIVHQSCIDWMAQSESASLSTFDGFVGSKSSSKGQLASLNGVRFSCCRVHLRQGECGDPPSISSGSRGSLSDKLGLTSDVKERASAGSTDTALAKAMRRLSRAAARPRKKCRVNMLSVGDFCFRVTQALCAAQRASSYKETR